MRAHAAPAQVIDTPGVGSDRNAGMHHASDGLPTADGRLYSTMSLFGLRAATIATVDLDQLARNGVHLGSSRAFEPVVGGAPIGA